MDNSTRDLSSLVAAASAVLGEPAEFVYVLSGGAHAETLLIRAGERELVAHRFPRGDDAVEREVEVLTRLAELGSSVPVLVAFRLDPDPVIVTTKVDGSFPAPDLGPRVIATRMGRMLARIHALEPAGLPRGRERALIGSTPIVRAARDRPPASDPSRDVLVHGDFWCGNAMWRADRLTGVVDWSTAHSGARGFDVAWCRQDLVLLGSPDAAAVLLDTYEEGSGASIGDIHEWDVLVGARTEPVVETWATNYLGIGRLELTPDVLRARLDEWNAALL